MNITKIKILKFKFKGDVVEQGKVLIFKAITSEGKEFISSDLKGTKVISVFPDVNTRICDAQTIKINQLANDHPEIKFISISMDKPSKLKEWCASHGTENMITLSDEEIRDFGIKTNLYIPKLKKLGRGVLVLDNKNKIISININKDMAQEPNYSYIEKLIE